VIVYFSAREAGRQLTAAGTVKEVRQKRTCSEFRGSTERFYLAILTNSHFVKGNVPEFGHIYLHTSMR
jgi:hypothetical protein